MTIDRSTVSDRADRLLSVAQVSAWLNVSTKTVYRRIGDGTLTAVRVGRLFRIRASSVAALIDEQITEELSVQSKKMEIVFPRLTTLPNN